MRWIWFLALALGCGAAPRNAAVAAAADAPDVVATVDGRPIRAADVARQARAAGQSPRDALAALIDAEAAAGEAARRGLADDPEVVRAAKQAMVRRYLADTFEKDVTPSSAIGDGELEKQYQRNLPYFVHPEGREVHHILARFAPGDSPAHRAALRARIDRVAERAKTAGTVEAFAALAFELSDGAVALEVQHATIDRSDANAKPFVDAAWALARPGDVSGVVETQFGYHVIRFDAAVPAKDVDLAAARDEIRAGLWPSVQQREFARFVDKLVDRHQVAVRPQLLAERSR